MHITPLRPLSALALASAILMSGCQSSSSDTAAPVAAVAVQPVETAAVEVSPRDRAAVALKAERLFAPAGDNAFELYLDALDADPQDALSRNALTDLMPYAVMQVEQRLAANEVSGAARLLGLIKRADPAAPAIPRLTASMKTLREQVVQQKEEREAALVAAAAKPAPAVTPTPVREATQRAEAKTLARTPAPSVAKPAPATSAQMPAVLTQVPTRYPPQAQRRGLEGRVELAFTIGTNGQVSDISVVAAEPAGVFDRAAMSAMQRWRFAPPAQSMRGRRTFEFKLTANGGQRNELARR